MTRRMLLTLLVCLPLASLLAFDAVTETAAPPRVLDYKFPPGVTYWMNPTSLVFEGQVGMTITGTRTNGVPSRVVYRGPATRGVIQLVGCTRCKLIDLEIVDEAGCDATVLLTNAVDPPSTGYSTGNVVSNVRVLLSGNGKASKRAFSVDSTAAGGTDANNDHHTFERCYAQSYTEAGFYVKGPQSHDHLFDQCQAHDAGGRKPVGLHAAGAVFFEWRRGAMNSNGTDFLLGSPETQAVISGHNSENGQQFVKAKFNGQCFVRATDVRFDGQIAAGKPVVDATGPGPWSIGNSYFAGVNGLCPTMRFVGASPGSLDLSGVMIRQHGGTYPLGPVVAAPATWDNRVHGLTHQMIDSLGRRIDKKLYLNTLGVQ